jgi:alkylated DNA repair dioxygenase AlkB
MFTYLRVYDPGAILGTHRDQPSCRWNVDLVVGGEPRPERRNAWPLWLDGRRGPEPVRLGLGDGLLYRGDRLQHWRHAQPRRHTTVPASLHYGPPGQKPLKQPVNQAHQVPAVPHTLA